MKRYRFLALLMMVLLCFATGVVFAQDATEQPSAARPALVPCVKGENVPCVQNVTQASDLVGTWRSYLRDSSGIRLGFTIYKADGSIAVTSNLQTAPTVISSVSFASGIARITANNGATVTNCVSAGNYEMRVLRMGDQPIALTYHEIVPASDFCFGRTGGFVQPMIYYAGTGKDVPPLDPSSDALTQSLVPCLALTRPCDTIATKVDDLKGYWKTYFSPGDTGFGFQRFNDAGGDMMVSKGDDPSTLKAFFNPDVPSPHNFYGPVYVTGDPNDGNDCGLSLDYMRVIKFGNQRVALQWTAIQDACDERTDNFSDAQIWIKGL